MSLLLLAGVTASASTVEYQVSGDVPETRPQTSDPGNPQSAIRLVPGVPIERELAGGEVHTYQVRLVSGQYLHVVVEQRGIDVVVRLFRPDGEQITEADSSTGTQGSERLSVVAETWGVYQMEVRSQRGKAAPGRYEVRIEELRESTAQDRSRVAAERAFAEGKQLRRQRTAESLRGAIEKYEEALPLWREARDRQGEAETLVNLGLVYWSLGEPQQVLEYLDQALPLWRAVADRRGKANTLTGIGAAYRLLGEPRKALESYYQALPLWRAVADRRGEAMTLNNIGLVYWSLGEPRKALESYDQALLLRRAVGDRGGEAVTLINIGLVYASLGEAQKAMENYRQALPLLRAVGDRRREAVTLNNLGLVYASLSELQKAMEYYRQALPLRRAVADRRGEAITLNNIGSVYRSLGEPQKALESYHQALPLRRAVADRRGEAITLNNIGLVYWRLGELQKALESYHQALPLMRAVRNRHGEARTLTNIGKVYARLGESQKALECYHQALPLSRVVGDRGGEAITLYGIARVERDRGNLTEARTHHAAALDIIESLRTKVASQQLRSSYLASKQNYYDFYINLLMRLHHRHPSKGHNMAALQACERARARSLLELLAEANIDVRQGIEPGLKQRERDSHARIAWIQRQLIETHSHPKPDQSKIATLEEELKKADAEREQLELEIRQKHPRYADLQYPTPLGLKEIQELLDNQTVLLEYALGEEASFLFAVTKQSFRVARLPAASSLSQRVKELRDTMASTPRRTAHFNYITHARQLYQELIQPANELIADKQAFIIVPDGILNYLPFEVLLQSGDVRDLILTGPQRWPYLVCDYAISYAPSASVLAGLWHQRQEQQRPPDMFLAYADPTYGTEAPTKASPIGSALRSAFGEGQPWKLEALPLSRREAERIASLYPDDQVDLFLREQAREENVKAKDRLGRYRFIHFAVHGLLNENKPQYSGLVLSLPQEKDSRPKTRDPSSTNPKSQLPTPESIEDGLLQVYEIFNLKMNADLVVLSACETGLGKEVRGEGLVGLTRAFLYAGTPSVVVSLWKVEDRSTAELMVRFYQHLNDKKLSKAEALRQAQLDLIGDGKFAHPYHWAPFILVGEAH